MVASSFTITKHVCETCFFFLVDLKPHEIFIIKSLFGKKTVLFLLCFDERNLHGYKFSHVNTPSFGCCLFLCYYCYQKVSMMLTGGYVLLIPWVLVLYIKGNIFHISRLILGSHVTSLFCKIQNWRAIKVIIFIGHEGKGKVCIRANCGPSGRSLSPLL